MTSLKLYVILTREGKLKRGSNGLAVYVSMNRAISWALEDGDSVVPMELDLETATPVFIRRKVVESG